MRLLSLGLKPQGFTARLDKVIERPADIDGCDLFAVVDGQVGVIQRFGTFGRDGAASSRRSASLRRAAG